MSNKITGNEPAKQLTERQWEVLTFLKRYGSVWRGNMNTLVVNALLKKGFVKIDNENRVQIKRAGLTAINTNPVKE